MSASKPATWAKAERPIEHIRSNLHRDDIIALRNWIEANLNHFASDVHGPICMEVEFTETCSANIIEMLVENHFLHPFLVVDEHDFHAVESSIRERKFSGITLTRFGHSRSQLSQAPDLSKFGFAHFAHSLIKGPSPVVEFLNRVGELGHVPIGQGPVAREHTARLDRAAFPENSIARSITDNVVYKVTKSRHSEHSSILSTPIKQSRIWREVSQGGEDATLLEGEASKTARKVQDLEARRDEANLQQRQFQNQISEQSKRIQEIPDRLRQKRNMEQKIQAHPGQGRAAGAGAGVAAEEAAVTGGRRRAPLRPPQFAKA
jgi:chromosome segregation ATPase